MNPSSSVFSGLYRGGSRFQTPSGTTITIDSPLEPFFQPNGEFYTSRIAADLRNFGYTYEGLEYWTKSQAQMRADATRLVNRLYSPADAASGVAGGPAMFAAKKPSTRYFIQLELDMAQVPRPCQVQAWIGGKFAGSMVVLQQPGHGIMRGGFPIDNAVREAGLDKLAKDKAVAKIKESLKVNIVKGNNEEVPIRSVSSFKWQLEDITFTPAKGAESLPKFSNPNMHDLQTGS